MKSFCAKKLHVSPNKPEIHKSVTRAPTPLTNSIRATTN